MANVRFVIRAYSDYAATISATSEVQPIENAFNSISSKVWESSGTTNQSIVMTGMGGANIAAVCLWNTNFIIGDTIRVLGENISPPSTVYDQTFAFSGLTPGLYLNNQWRTTDNPWERQKFMAWLGQNYDAQQWTLILNSTGGPYSGFKVGRVYMGPVYSPTLNMAYGSSIQWNDDSRRYRGVNGILYPELGKGSYRSFSVVLNDIPLNEVCELLCLLQYKGKRSDTVVSLYPELGFDDYDALQTDLGEMLGRFVSWEGYQNTEYNLWTLTLNFEESI